MNLPVILALFKDYGSDPVVGFIAIIGTIIVYAIWFAIDSDSASRSIERGTYTPGEVGPNNAKNRRRAKKRRDNQIARIRSITEPNEDGQYLYIFQSNGLYKVGISNNP